MKPLGIIFAIGAAVAWGAVYALDQKILVKLSPLTLLIVSSIVTLVICIPLSLWLEPQAMKSFLGSGKTVQVLLLVSTILVIGANYLILSSVQKLGAATASILEISYPFFVVLFVALMFGSQVNASFWVGALLIFAGAATIIKAA